MDGRIGGIYTNGTSALKLDNWHSPTGKGSIIAFPDNAVSGAFKQADSVIGTILATAKRKVRDILAASEMYCSLRFEDFMGCPYRIFSRKGIAVLSSSVAVLAIVSIVVGA